MQNEIVLRFCIWNFDDITHDDITTIIETAPFKIVIKGERKNPNFSAPAKHNGWILSSPVEKYASFDEQMNALLDILEPKINVLKPLCLKYDCEFSCAVFIGYNNGESTPWLHLNERYNRLIRELKIEFDVDIYCLSNK